ncbi:MAG: NUDIX hydrolase [Eubacteriales bacterium]|jgi:isopentenyldiphosphate isomerase
MELWECLDSERRPTGRIAERGSSLRNGEYHLVVHACVFSSDECMLIQRRHPEKKLWPSLWDLTTAGSAVAGESSSEAAARELSEEIGLALDFHGKRPGLSVNYGNNFDDFYIVRWDGDISSLKLQPEEVCEVRWAGREEIHGLIKSGVFVPYYHSLIDVLFDINQNETLIYRN